MFEALVWAVGDVEGLEHDATTMPEVPEPETLPVLGDLMAAKGIEPFYPFWSNFEERVVDWIDDQQEWENRAPSDPVWGHWFKYVPRSTFDDPWVDACRSLILLDTRDLAGDLQPAREQRVHGAEHRHHGRLPPLTTRRTVALLASRAPRARQEASSAAKVASGPATEPCSRSARVICCAVRPRRGPERRPPMEDRRTPGLYLEMTDRAIDAYARVPGTRGARIARCAACDVVAQRAPRS